jgi:Helix-turn-helix domain
VERVSERGEGEDASGMTERRRKRRIAADEAHAWARNLRLGNAHAKYVLCMITGYVNGDGVCFVSIPHLADDCELAPDTIRRRLAWLEDIGAIARRAQWLDGTGRRNSDGKGARTSDEIVLLIESEVEDIEARAQAVNNAPTPSQEQGGGAGQERGGDSIGTPLAPALRQGAESSEPEPELEDSPQPPCGGSVENLLGWEDFERDWQEPILRQSLAQQVWRSFSDAEKELARNAARGYVAWRRSQNKPPNVLGAHLFLKERDAWPRFAEMASRAGFSGGTIVAADSTDAKAIEVAYLLAGKADALRSFMRLPNGNISYRLEITEQLRSLALAPLSGAWVVLDARQAVAWNTLIAATVPIETRRKLAHGDRAPWGWPPSKEGKIYASTGPPEAQLTEEDAKELQNFK